MPAIIWAFLILLLCGFPGNKIPELTFLEWLHPDKIAHLLIFGVQCFLLLKGFEKQTQYGFLNRNYISLALTISVLYGCIVEVLQEYVFLHRSGDFRDTIANAIGAFLGLWIYRKYSTKVVNGY